MIWLLIAFGVVYGWSAALVVQRLSDRRRVRASVNRISGHMMALQLFLDSPSVILRTQRDLVRENVRLLALVGPASLIPTAIFILLFPQLDAVFGHSPLPVGERAVVTVRADEAHLEVPAGFVIETPAIHAARDHEVSWRLRPVGTARGDLKARSSDTLMTREIVSGAGLVTEWTLPLSTPAIDIRYPRRVFWGLNWMVWFLAVSAISAAVSAIGWNR